ncbi:hypothetical protein BCR33DRAFT_713711 [Rhizoclosmatium globosum]|uniref:SAM domain-containing protein n=1 Tax=Rhizoclosmatium globosum TaxID=329046 RepID=A0A1Y2CQY4_9FUNG|nr:hypothetical protein BCR33DRAFT_713711 [Rhizoclosmatium globosum]|eukprot:ORY49356.1 hypothetical protein BCR33DRAFT_713711 [Rhizoclosmatium globosum]
MFTACANDPPSAWQTVYNSVSANRASAYATGSSGSQATETAGTNTDSSSSNSSDNSSSSSSSSSLGTGAIVGIVVGVVIALALLAVLIGFYKKRTQKKQYDGVPLDDIFAATVNGQRTKSMREELLQQQQQGLNESVGASELMRNERFLVAAGSVVGSPPVSEVAAPTIQITAPAIAREPTVIETTPVITYDPPSTPAASEAPSTQPDSYHQSQYSYTPEEQQQYYEQQKQQYYQQYFQQNQHLFYQQQPMYMDPVQQQQYYASQGYIFVPPPQQSVVLPPPVPPTFTPATTPVRESTVKTVDTLIVSNVNEGKDAAQWNVEEAVKWVVATGLGGSETVEAMREHEIDGQALMLLTADDLEKTLKVTKLGQRLKLSDAIKGLSVAKSAE